MGLGDEIMATAMISAEKEKYPDHYIVCCKPQHHDPYRGYFSEEQAVIFKNNPKVHQYREVMNKGKIRFIQNYPGTRPYTRNIQGGGRKYNFVYDFKVEPGEIYWDDEEKEKIEKLKVKYHNHILLNQQRIASPA